jgi:hypothetical protein
MVALGDGTASNYSLIEVPMAEALLNADAKLDQVGGVVLGWELHWAIPPWVM